LLLRSRLVSAVRRFLRGPRFIEVETPILQSSPAARRRGPSPPTTTRWAWISSCASRWSCYLKRLLVGGFDRVFEIGRNFRNEGISRRHNPEFTMLEVYQAYSDYRGMMTLDQRSAADAGARCPGHEPGDPARGQRPGDQLRRRVARGEVQGPHPRDDGRRRLVRAQQGGEDRRRRRSSGLKRQSGVGGLRDHQRDLLEEASSRR
jgi:hypothetical protein